MYTQLLTYFKTPSQLICYCMTIASWYLVIIGNSERVLAGDAAIQDEQSLPTTRIAQVTTPIPPVVIPTLVVPVSLPTLLPPSSSIFPLNSILTPELIPAPNNTPAVPSTNAPTAPTRDPRFIIAPQVLDPNAVDPFSTQFILNGNRVSHLTKTVAAAGFETGNFRNTDLSFDVYKLIRASSVQSVTADRVVRVNSQVESTGIRSVIQNQNIAVSVAQPQTLLGFRQF